ncbi:MAG: acyl--CoA ligase [Deltaproteobacteria bacterium]|nr:acyl--CoA ligase [Deltaproteobacteria bacterium]
MNVHKEISTGRIVERGAELASDKVAVVDGERRVTYRDLDSLVNSLAATLTEIGFKKGDRVAIYMKNSIELVIAFFAIQKLGVIVAWVNPNYRRSESQFILQNSGARGVFIFQEWEGYGYSQAISEMRDELPALEWVFVVGEGQGEGVLSFDELIRRGRGKRFSPPSVNIREDLSMLIYTSGTTGRPKGAMITHTQAVQAGWQYSLGIAAGPEDIFIGFLPMTHSYGCGAILIQPLLLMSTVVLLDKFDVRRAFQIIQQEKVTLQLAAPAHYFLELNHPERNSFDLSSLRAGLIAGQIAPEGLITRIHDEMNAYVSSFWGASEVGPGVGIMCPYPTPLESRERYIGHAVEDTQVRVVDPVTGKELPEGEIGELTLRGWHVMKGYWQNPDETAKQIRNGWLFMGDLVSRERDGFFRIYGRTKDLINRGGFKIYAYELESMMIEHPGIHEVSVVATPNPVLGESICACVVPKPDRQITLSELRAFLKGKVASYKLPDELCVVRDFPRLSGGVKINKFGKGGLSEMAQNDPARERHRP